MKQNCKTRKKTWDKNTPNVAIKMTIGIYFESSALSFFSSSFPRVKTNRFPHKKVSVFRIAA